MKHKIHIVSGSEPSQSQQEVWEWKEKALRFIINNTNKAIEEIKRKRNSSSVAAEPKVKYGKE